jgi:hypothetical protein
MEIEIQIVLSLQGGGSRGGVDKDLFFPLTPTLSAGGRGRGRGRKMGVNDGLHA